MQTHSVMRNTSVNKIRPSRSLIQRISPEEEVKAGSSRCLLGSRGHASLVLHFVVLHVTRENEKLFSNTRPPNQILQQQRGPRTMAALPKSRRTSSCLLPPGSRKQLLLAHQRPHLVELISKAYGTFQAGNTHAMSIQTAFLR